jgi:UDP-glucuronate 4-epimerase
VRGTVVLLEASRIHGVRKFVFGSSSSVYGISTRVPFSEDDPLCFPVSPYAATKIAGEMLCRTWAHLYALPIVALRFFTVYGPRQRPDLAICKFTDMIDRGQWLPVFGDGSTARDYTFVNDIVRGILAAVEYQCSFDVFNLGNSDPVSLRTMIRTIEQALGKEALLKHVPEQAGDVPITYADLSKSRTLLGYQPTTGFTEGVRCFLEWRSKQQMDRRSASASMAS